MSAPAPERVVTLRRADVGDVWWLTAVGLDPELAGVQYSWVEAPLQLVVAPLRALLAPFVPARLVLVDGRRAGYVGRSPLSGSYEYFLRPWARGGGVGRRAVREFLADHRGADRSRKLYVRRANTRSEAMLRGVLDSLGWEDGREYDVRAAGHHHVFTVRSQA